jgi:hypothetical protein
MYKSNPELYTKFTSQEKTIIKGSIICMLTLTAIFLLAFNVGGILEVFAAIAFAILLFWIIGSLWFRKGTPASFIFWFH